MLCDPLNRVIFRNKALDYFGFAIGPQNIDPPARSGIFPSHVSWSLLEHPSNMRLRRPGSSQQSCHNQTADSALALAAASMSGAAISLSEGSAAISDSAFRLHDAMRATKRERCRPVLEGWQAAF